MSGSAPLVVVGPGRVGRSLAGALAASGRRVEAVGREPDLPENVLGRSGLTLLFAVPDDALEAAARAWALRLQRTARADDRVALHTSGVHPADALAPLRERGLAVGGWHPLVSLAAPDERAFRGAACGLHGDEEAVRRGREVAEAVGARPVALGEAERSRYHAAAVFASNHLVACLAAADEELRAATGEGAGLEELLPLARSALANVERRGLADGLTGPVRRGDAGTVRRHLAGLGPRRAALYRGLARELLALVEADLPETERAALEAALRDGASGGEEAG